MLRTVEVHGFGWTGGRCSARALSGVARKARGTAALGTKNMEAGCWRGRPSCHTMAMSLVLSVVLEDQGGWCIYDIVRVLSGMLASHRNRLAFSDSVERCEGEARRCKWSCSHVVSCSYVVCSLKLILHSLPDWCLVENEGMSPQ